MMQLDIDRLLESVSGRYSRHYSAAIGDLIEALATQNAGAVSVARKRLSYVVRQTMGIAEVYGSMMVLRSLADAYAEDGAAKFAADSREAIRFRDSSGMLASVTFEEAVEDMLARTPVAIRDVAERSAARIAQIYSEGSGVAFAHSAELSVTERVQALIVQAMKEGQTEVEAGQTIKVGVDYARKETKEWTEAYSRMAFRTNVNTAITAGRFRQVQDPVVKAMVPCFRFDAVGDVDTRDNHAAANGLILKVDNPAWSRLAPPLGYACRCTVNHVTRPQLRRMGRIADDGSIREDAVPPGAHPDPGFRPAGGNRLMGAI